MIPYARQDIQQGDIDAVVAVLQSEFLTQGPLVPRFEQMVAERVQAAHGVAVNSATSALHVACLALGVGPGDRLWTVPNTFVASANCGRYCGADVDFVDIDPCTWTISILALQQKLEAARRANRLPKVVVPVHFAGQPAEQEAIWMLAQEYGFSVLEDASHAIGSVHNGEPLGSCRWSHITVFSFHAVKVITTMEGGMALTNDAGLAEKMTLLRSHGITRDPRAFRGPAKASDDDMRANIVPAPWQYEQQQLGFNYRMTDVQAALGMSQLARLDENVRRRNALAARYTAALGHLRVQLPPTQPNDLSAFHLYVVRLPRDPGHLDHGRVLTALRQRGVAATLHYPPVHLQPYYQDLGFGPGDYVEAETHGRTAITLPLYPSMTDEQQDLVIDALATVLGAD